MILVVLLAEVTYLVVKLPRQASGKKRYIFVDTSVLIDGRIIAVAQSGFISGTLAIPRSVIGELQYLADNADADKRSRARHGLDVANELQKIDGLDTVLFQDGSKAEEGVDERLLTLAKKHDGSICTIDYNLNKVATVEGITVCNVNELAKNLRMAYLPGEKTKLELVQKGQGNQQAVGYLPDGTMVVVEQAASLVGQMIEVEFIRSLQTAAGKMMFAKKSTDNTQLDSKPVAQRIKSSKTNVKKQQGDRTAVKLSQGSQQRQAKVTKLPTAKKRRPIDREAALLDLVDKQ